MAKGAKISSKKAIIRHCFATVCKSITSQLEGNALEPKQSYTSEMVAASVLGQNTKHELKLVAKRDILINM